MGNTTEREHDARGLRIPPLVSIRGDCISSVQLDGQAAVPGNLENRLIRTARLDVR